MRVSQFRCLAGAGVPSNGSSPLPNTHLGSLLGGIIPTGQAEVFVVLLLLLPLIVLLTLGCTTDRKRKKMFRAADERGGRSKDWKQPRAMSFGSALMSLGSWPTELNMPDTIITAFMYLDEAPDASTLEEVSSKLLGFHNFRSLPRRCQRPWFLPPLTRCQWQEIEVRPADVITRVEVKGSSQVLREMEKARDSPLPNTTADGRALPLWNIHVIENIDSTEGAPMLGTVVALRVHHCIGDGVSLMSAAQSVLEPVGEERTSETGDACSGTHTGASKPFFSPRVKLLSNFGVRKILSGMVDVLKIGSAVCDTPLPFGHLEAPTSRERCGEPWKEVSLDAQKRERGRKRHGYSGRRRIVMFPDISLRLLKTIKGTRGATVNDVMICLVAGSIRRYCEAMGAKEYLGGRNRKGFKSTALMPVALPRKIDPRDTGDALCNKWGLMSMGLHLDEPDPLTRLEKIKATSTAMKNSATPALLNLVESSLMPRLPVSVCREMAYDTVVKHSLAFSNIPGPQKPVNFAGRRLRRIHFCVNHILPSLGIVSLDGAVSMSLVVDPVTTADCLSLPSHFLDELRALVASARVEGSKELEKAQDDLGRILGLMKAAYPATS